jgi:hypothetical protein
MVVAVIRSQQGKLSRYEPLGYEISATLTELNAAYHMSEGTADYKARKRSAACQP